MCGINGVVIKSKQSQSEMNHILTKMNDLIVHRGPDDHGTYVTHSENFSLGMGMRRLSIIDLSTGHQPMYSDDDKVCIVFNGEIYNYKKLKNDLLDQGITFKTTSDTEVILKLYELHGKACFALLDGMYAISIHDSNLDKLFIARDFFGEKPLYYTVSNNHLYWASELKSIISCLPSKPEIDKNGLNLFFRLTYIPAPYTIYEGIQKLEPNNFIEYDLNDFSLIINQIHNPDLNEPLNFSFDEAKTKVRDLVFDSVLSRSVSDVPLGTFLSGGVDSSVVSYCLSELSDSKIDTFSIGFDKASYDETEKSRVVARLINSDHEILLNFDEPFADSSSLPTYIVSNKTKSFVKVALTGDGGDEVFGGYNKYYIGELNNRYTKYVPEFVHKGLANVV